MSALGQKRTCAAQNVMSALPPIADRCDANRDVRFVPRADIQEAARTRGYRRGEYAMQDFNARLAIRKISVASGTLPS